MKEVFINLSKEELEELIKCAIERTMISEKIKADETDSEDFIQTHDACLLLNISRTTLHNYVKKGLVVCYKLVGRAYYSRKQIESAIKTGKGGQNV